MKFGFVSAILGDQTFEEVVDFAADNGFDCIEMACWPKGKAERRYAGVTHIEIEVLNAERISYIKNYLTKKGVSISALGYYPNTMDPDLDKRKVYISHILALIDASAELGINRISTFIGRNPQKTVEDNLELFKEIWPPIIRHAEEKGVEVCIENCPMLFTNDEWPGGQNLATSPAIWRRMFEIIPSKNFGLNYDPSHMVWQHMDYIKPIYEFRDRIFHVHFKDIKLFPNKLDDVGIMATPLQYMSPKLPGLGDVEWKKFISALTDIGYRGNACIEVEDKAFEDSLAGCKEAVLVSKNYLKQFFA